MINFLLNIPISILLLTTAAWIILLVYSYATDLGEAKVKGVLRDGSKVSVKTQNVQRYHSWLGQTAPWKQNGTIPGIGILPGHVVEDAWKNWLVGAAFGAGILTVLIFMMIGVIR